MFNAPEIVANIPDIAQIYTINDQQCEALENAVEELDDNIFLDTMHESMITRWENILGIVPWDDDTISDRRFRVKANATERLPYSARVICRKLDTLCPDGYELNISDDRTQITVKLALKSKKMINDVINMLEEMLPLNMWHQTSIMWNQYGTVSNFRYGELAGKTHRELREEVFEF